MAQAIRKGCGTANGYPIGELFRAWVPSAFLLRHETTDGTEVLLDVICLISHFLMVLTRKLCKNNYMQKAISKSCLPRNCSFGGLSHESIRKDGEAGSCLRIHWLRMQNLQSHIRGLPLTAMKGMGAIAAITFHTSFICRKKVPTNNRGKTVRPHASRRSALHQCQTRAKAVGMQATPCSSLFEVESNHSEFT